MIPDPETHSDIVQAPEWWACAEPERPHDMEARYAMECPSCAVALDALSRHDPSMVMDRSDGEDGTLVAIDSAYEAAQLAREAVQP